MSVERARGQVLVLFALMLVVLLGFAALAVDVSGSWAEIRFERATADAAALAGASDMYRAGTNDVGPPEWQNAVGHALRNLVDELDPGYHAGDPLPACPVDATAAHVQVINCPVPGTSWHVSILAPAPSCQAGGCDPNRSVQVTVRDPAHALGFARLFGQESWNLAVTSVAERHRGSDYSFVTLRPPKPSRRHSSWCSPNCDDNDDNITLDGTNTRLSVLGDTGTNTNMQLTNGATVVLQPGSYVDHYDAYQLWTSPPPGRQIPAPIPDPGYLIPARPTAPALTYLASDPLAAWLSASDCAIQVAALPAGYPRPADPAAVACLRPGRYEFAPGQGPEYAGIHTLLLTPGVYFLESGFMPGNGVDVIGGYEPGRPGVALVFHDGDACPHAGGCRFAGNTVDLLALNAGDAYPDGASGTPASAAVNWDGAVVETSGRVHLPMTLIVERDPACVVATRDTDACHTAALHNQQLNLPGSGSLYAFGVQYAPTDNVAISGGSGSNGYLGQIWAWTVKYSGGSTINLVGADNPEPGVLRIATPCSPAASCVNPEAAASLAP